MLGRRLIVYAILCVLYFLRFLRFPCFLRFQCFLHFLIEICAMFENRITKLFGIEYPIVQAGMIWASGWRLASAVSEAGGLGVIGAGSMYPDVLRDHIRKC